MHRDRLVAGALATFLATLILTVAIAWPVVRSPSTRIFGFEIDGRHHDPFTVMWQFQTGRPALPYRQPLVDDVGALLAKVVGPVAAFNFIVLISFPLTASATFVLGRYLRLSNTGAIVSALAFAFAPIHLAHAAYHPHVAQTQWIPLYFLALWVCADRVTLGRIALLAAAVAALALSNLYAAFTCAVLTPVALARGADRDLCETEPGFSEIRRRATLVVISAAGLLLLGLAAHAMFADLPDFAFPDSDAMQFAARWWAYIVPPVDGAVFGAAARRFWDSTGLTNAVTEQQLYVSVGLLMLAGIAGARWIRRDQLRHPADSRLRTALVSVPVLVAVAVLATVCSLAPPMPDVSFLMPASALHASLPIFRSYARFGIVTHLMIALLAGAGVMCLWSRRMTTATADAARGPRGPMQMATPILLAIVAFEYLPIPWRSRDVLPTRAHRWLAAQPRELRALDCVSASPDMALVPWLMQRDVTFLSDYSPGCHSQPSELSALGFTHLIVRTSGTEASSTVLHAHPRLTLARSFEDAQVFTVPAEKASFVAADASGFYPVERENDRTWRWMGQRGAWFVRNTTNTELPIVADVELAAFAHARRVLVSVGTRRVADIRVVPDRRWYRVGPVRIGPGDHHLFLDAVEPATVADTVIHNGDRRALTIMIGERRWTSAPPVVSVQAVR